MLKRYKGVENDQGNVGHELSCLVFSILSNHHSFMDLRHGLYDLFNFGKLNTTLSNIKKAIANATVL